MNVKEYALQILLQLSFVPYRWGGANPLVGFDCSGLVIEVLKSVGILGVKDDFTAQGLSDHFPETENIEPGVILFYDWDGDGKIDHCEMVSGVLDNGLVITVGASGGGVTTTELKMAELQNAYVKHRVAREGYVKVCNPFAVVEA